MNTRCPPKRVPSATRFFTLCRLTVQPPQSYSVGGQRSSGQLTGKPAGARPDYRGRWCAIVPQEMTENCFWIKVKEEKFESPDLFTKMALLFATKTTEGLKYKHYLQSKVNNPGVDNSVVVPVYLG
ncbi:UNVERIFIED_CONTAM: hypothetical protein FKN15_041579 [Acipenser sinensis]